MQSGILVDDAGTEEYWLNELNSLGIEVKRKNEFNDKEELENLADGVKQALLQEYKTACSQA